MDFIGLVTWSGDKRAMKERIRKAQRVFKGYMKEEMKETMQVLKKEFSRTRNI